MLYKLGKNCTLYHVRICRNSLKNGVCENIGDGKKCHHGYHVKGTKSQPNLQSDGSSGTTGQGNQKANHSKNHKKQKNGHQNNNMGQDAIKAFLGEIVMSQLAKKPVKENKPKHPQNPLLQMFAKLMN